MSRGQLDKSDWERINGSLPNLGYIRNTIGSLTPEILSFLFHPNSYIPVASVCFKDVLASLNGAAHALSEAFAHQIWYLEKTNPPDELGAIYFRKYYLDDAALRLYSAGEHLADGILMMMEIDKSALKIKGSSKQIKLGNYLITQKSEHPVSRIVDELAHSTIWLQTLKYRNDWVHEQPPLITGLGIAYNRKIRWKTSPQGNGIAMNGIGDIPEFSVEDLEAFIRPSAIIFHKVFLGIIKYYLELLKSYGFTVTDKEYSSAISVNFKTINRPKWWDEKSIKVD